MFEDSGDDDGPEERFTLERPDDESEEDDWVVHDWLTGEDLGDDEGEIIYIGRANGELALAHAIATGGETLRLDIDDGRFESEAEHGAH